MSNTTATTQHTPTPWDLGKSDGKGICSIDALDPKDGQWFMVCEVMGIEHIREWSEEAAANPAFIVRACNSNAALVNALQLLADKVEACGGYPAFRDELQHARAALHLAAAGA